jgi:transposase
VAIVLADNRKPHTPRGSLLVRQMLADLEGQLVLLYTPRYDPEANRIEWLWRVVRHAVTHHHQCPTFALLRDDLRAAVPGAGRRPCGRAPAYREPRLS